MNYDLQMVVSISDDHRPLTDHWYGINNYDIKKAHDVILEFSLRVFTLIVLIDISGH